MFTVKLGIERNGQLCPFNLCIEGCPTSGVEAIDFRRKHGLPDEASNTIQVPCFSFTDEEFVRKHHKKATQGADLELRYASQYLYHCNAVGQVYVSTSGQHLDRGGYLLEVQPSAILAYWKDQTPETGKALYEDILNRVERSKLQAEEEARQYQEEKARKEAKIQEARELLKEELSKLHSENEKLLKKVAYLEGELEEVRKELQEQEA